MSCGQPQRRRPAGSAATMRACRSLPINAGLLAVACFGCRHAAAPVSATQPVVVPSRAPMAAPAASPLPLPSTAPSAVPESPCDATPPDGDANPDYPCLDCRTQPFPNAEERALKATMVTRVYQHREFRALACAAATCPRSEFEQFITVRRERLNDAPELVAYFVDTARGTKNGYSGFFLLRNHRLTFEFIAFGSTGPINQRDAKGYRIVRTSQTTSLTSWDDQYYRWNGSHYEAFDTKSVDCTPEPKPDTEP